MSDGVAIIRALLVADAGVTALVPATRIAAGAMPQGTSLPYISLQLVSSIDRNIIAPGSKRRVTDRVQVTAVGASYAAMKAVMKAVKKAGADKFATGDGVIHTDGAGPDLMDETASLYIGSQDFRVSYNEVR